MSSKATKSAAKSSKTKSAPSATATATSSSSAAAPADSRFDRFTYDAKFAVTKKTGQTGKVKVDERFKSVFNDEFGSGKGGKVDKYGRVMQKAGGSEMSKYYEMEGSSSRHEMLTRIARGEVALESSDSSDSDDEGEEGDEAQETLPTSVIESGQVELGEASGNRLAILNCDWDRIRAVDLLAILQSFLPSTGGGSIKSVKIYPSEFGLARLKAEETDGPQMRAPVQKINPAASENGGDEGLSAEDDDDDDVSNGMRDNVEGEAYDPEILRVYEKDRLAYYFAVATFDSIATAAAVYDECDGVEFEHSSVTLDLRFIPDSLVITTPLKDEAAHVPDNYAPVEFVAQALQNSKVELTWDEPEFDRRKLERWDRDRFTKKGGGIKTDQLEMFLGSEDDEDGEDEEQAAKRVERYRALLDRPNGPAGNAAKSLTKAATTTTSAKDDVENSDDDGTGSADDGGLEIVFSEDDDDEEEEDGSPAQQQPLRSKFAKQRPIAKGQDEEPEDPLAASKHKSKKKKKKQQHAAKEEGDIDVEDSRFADLYTDPKFTLDRTDPRYKTSKVTKKIDEEKRKRRKRA